MRARYVPLGLAALCTVAMWVNRSAAQEPQKAGFPAARVDEKARLQFDGEWRSYAQSTTNQGDLKDWASLASGGHLGVRSPQFLGLSLGVRGYLSVGVVGNTIKSDPVTGRPSRYELGLYDVSNPENREIGLLGEAYLAGTYDSVQFWLGRHKLKTPFFNPQDGRMIPTLAQGAWLQVKPSAGLQFQAGIVTHVAPRSTAQFYSIEDSFGLYPQGRNVKGQSGAYRSRVSSAGLFVGSIRYEKGPISASIWDFAVQNVFNTVYSEARWNVISNDVRGGKKPALLSAGFQFLAQQRLADGGPSEKIDAPNGGLSSSVPAYFEQKEAYAFGGQLQWRPADSWLLSGAYNRITDHGRFLFPREWGREPLYTFQKRERSEGSGDQHSGLIEVEKSFASKTWGRLVSRVGHSVSFRPHPREPELNKYALPSLYQLNVDTYYHAPAALSGLTIEALVAYKVSLAGVTENAAWVQNKVNMINWNLIVSYKF